MLRILTIICRRKCRTEPNLSFASLRKESSNLFNSTNKPYNPPKNDTHFPYSRSTVSLDVRKLEKTDKYENEENKNNGVSTPEIHLILNPANEN